MKKTLWVTMVFLSVVFAVGSWRYIFFTDFFVSEGWQHHLYRHPLATYAHFGLGPFALLIGGFQFLAGFRKKWPKVHRVIGRAYVISCILAGVGALPLAINSKEGPIAALGFGMLAAAWLYTTVSAFWAAQERQFMRHQVWMIRSFALTFAGVTLRLYLMTFASFLEWDFGTVYAVSSWACWVLNLLIAELFIIRRLKL